LKGKVSFQVVLPDGSKSVLKPARWPVTIGRANDNTISVPDDTTLSQHHLKIAITSEDRLFVLDLGSTNGSRVNGKKIGTLPYDLKSGDEIRAGKTTARVGIESSPAGKPAGGLGGRIARAATTLFRGVLKGEKLPPGYARCPNCGARIHAGSRGRGARIGCPRCKNIFVLGENE
jgi:hypothetical protein